MLAQLTDDHDRIREIANRIDAYLEQSSAPVDIEFSRLRWALIRNLTLHLARERAVFSVHAPELDHGCLDGTLDAQFEEYVATWSARAIQRGWAHYCRATRTLLDQLRSRMRREEDYLFPRYAQAVSQLALH